MLASVDSAVLEGVEGRLVRVEVHVSTGLPGYTVVRAVSASDSIASKSVTVFCPGNTRVIGTGYATTGGEGNIIVNTLRPSTTSVTATASEDQDGTTAAWSVEAQAVCANQPAVPLVGSLVRIRSNLLTRPPAKAATTVPAMAPAMVRVATA